MYARTHTQMVLGEPMLALLSEEALSMKIEMFWKVAQVASTCVPQPVLCMLSTHHSQMLFSLFICIALFSQSLFGLPFAVLGFWKMGFPETAGHYQCALCIGKVCELLIAAQSQCCSSHSADVMCRSASPRYMRTLMDLTHHYITRQVILPC